MTIVGFDLIFVQAPSGRSMSAGVVFADGTTTQVGPFPSVGAFGPIAEALRALDPEQFDDEQQTQLRLTVMHFQNMSRGANDAGQSYPFQLGSDQ